MDEFRINSKAGSEIEIIQELPEKLKRYKLPMAAATTAVCNFGTMGFQHVQGDEWSIWKSTYMINSDAEISGTYDLPIIELHTAQKNNFLYDWDGIRQPSAKALQFNLTYTPFLRNTAWLKAGQLYETFDFHLTPAMLADYVKVYPELEEFMGKVLRGKPAQLGGECIMTKKMQSLLKDMQEFDCHPGIYLKTMKARIEVFLAEALETLCTKKPVKKLIITNDLREKAMQARDILDRRLADPPSIAELARLCMSNTYSIQVAFKHFFSMTIDEYSKNVRLEEVKKLLLKSGEETLDLNGIADATGYFDAASLSRFFKSKVHKTPGEFRKDRNRNK